MNQMAGGYSRRLFVLCSVVVACAAFLAHGNSMRAGFVLDDVPLVVSNPFLQEPSNIVRVVSPRSVVYPLDQKARARPLLLFSLLTDRAVWGDGPAGYHLSSLVVHALVSVGVFVLAFLCAGSCRFETALSAGLLFAVHPIQCEAISVIANRADLLASLFFVCCACVFLSGISGSSPLGVGAAACALALCVCALLSKETALLLPFALGGLAVIRGPASLNARSAGFIVFMTMIAAVFLVLFWIPRVNYPLFDTVYPAIMGGRAPLSSFTALGNTICASFVHAVASIGMPLWLSPEYQIDISGPFLNPVTLIAFLSAGGLAWVIVRSGNIGVRCGAVLACAAYLPVSNIIPLTNTVADRYLYLPFAGVSIAIASLLFGSARPGFSRRFILVAVVVPVLAYLSLTHHEVYADGFSAAVRSVRIAPENPRARFNLGVAYGHAGDYRNALNEFSAARSANPLFLPLENRFAAGCAAELMGDYGAAFKRYAVVNALSGRVRSAGIQAELALRSGRVFDAVTLFQRYPSIMLSPGSLLLLAEYFAQNKEPFFAELVLWRSIVLDPRGMRAWMTLLDMRIKSGDLAGARRVAEFMQREYRARRWPLSAELEGALRQPGFLLDSTRQ